MTQQHAKQGQDLKALRNTNVTALLAAVWHHGPISRSELARRTGLAPSSITRLSRDLAAAGLIRETSKGRSSGGRQPTLLALDEAACLVAGIDLSGVELRAWVMNALGDPVVTVEQPFRGVGPEAIMQQLTEVMELLIRHLSIVPRKVLGVGVSVPGSVDSSTGVVIDSTNLALRNFPLGEWLRDVVDLPVFVEHDTTAAALAEKFYGAGREATNLIYITVSTGIGTGLIINEQVYRGERGLAGELGHITVERDGQLCLCGKHGCLETVASIPAIIAAARRMVDQGSNGGLAAWINDGKGALTIAAVMQAAQQGDRLAMEIFRNAADYLAMAISTLVCILDIRLVIIGGEVVDVGQPFIDPLRAALARYELLDMAATVMPAQLEHDAALKGVSMVVVQQILKLGG